AHGLIAHPPALPIGATQQVRDVLTTLPPPPIGDNVNRTRRTRSPRHTRSITRPPDGHYALLMTTPSSTRKAGTPATTGIPASQKPVIGGNFGLSASRSSPRAGAPTRFRFQSSRARLPLAESRVISTAPALGQTELS